MHIVPYHGLGMTAYYYSFTETGINIQGISGDRGREGQTALGPLIPRRRPSPRSLRALLARNLEADGNQANTASYRRSPRHRY